MGIACPPCKPRRKRHRPCRWPCPGDPTPPFLRRQLEQSRSGGGRAEPLGQLQTSQSHVLGSKPDYQRILDEQGQVLRGMELVVGPVSRPPARIR